MREAKQLLRDADVTPTAEIIAAGLGAANQAYIEFIGELPHYDLSLMDWRYYNDGKAWLSKGEYKWVTKRGTNKVKPIFWLSIWEGFFRIAFFFRNDTRDQLITLPISQSTRELIQNAKAMGKTMKYLPVVFDVRDDQPLSDLLMLSQFRKEAI